MERDRGNGFELRLSDVVYSVSTVLDYVSPLVAGHHRRVGRMVRAIARELNVPGDELRDLLLAAALHDIGAFSLKERLDLLEFEDRHVEPHAGAGYRLLRSFRHFEHPAELVRFHHLPWERGRGEKSRGEAVPLGSHLLHLADRASVLPVDRADLSRSSAAVLRAVAAQSGTRFVPEAVEAFAAAAGRPGFWDEIGAAGDVDLREDPLLSAETLCDADLRALARMFWQIVDFRSRFTATHTSGVAAVAGFLAPLAGVASAASRLVEIAAGLHDLGKLAVPSEILEKERPLDLRERRSLQDHPLHGWRILGSLRGLEQVNRWANFHHERIDGSGYPFAVAGGQIPLESRIVAVSDVFTALTEERPYRRGMSAREAVEILHGMADDGALDHEVVGVLERNREGASFVRRHAQQLASEHYLAFLEPSPAIAQQHSAA